MSKPIVYLLPTVLVEGAIDCLPAYITDAVKKCNVFFVENERTARRYLKLLWKEMVIDDYEWFSMNDEAACLSSFRKMILERKSIGIISEAGCPGIADPGQKLVSFAQEMKVQVKPLVGPSSILLALMASGMNGQQFRFCGYLPIEKQEKLKAIASLEAESKQKQCTQIFIETPYRNNQMMEALIRQCHPSTLICVASEITGPNEWIRTKPAREWKKEMPELHKKPVIFLLQSI